MDSWGISNLYDLLPNPSSFATIQQGLLFNKQRKTQYTNSLLKNNRVSFAKEGFSKEGFANNTSSISAKTQSEISALQELEKLKATYDGLIKQQQANQSSLSGKADTYIKVSSNENIYAGKNVLLKNAGALGYVTNKGVFKWYYDWTIISETAGKNGCPPLVSDDDFMTLEEIKGADYSTEGTVLSRNPRIIAGTPMTLGQSCGNENTNVYVSGSVAPPATYSGCYKDASNRTMTEQKDGRIFDYESCKQRAVDTSSQYFALQDYDTNAKLAQCFVGNDYDKATSLGSADTYLTTNLWSTTHAAYKNCYGMLKNDGNLYTYDSKGTELSNTMTGTPDCALTVPSLISATWGGNRDGIEDDNATSAVQSYNTGKQSFSYVVSKGMANPASGKKKSFDLSYQCADKIKTQHIDKGESQTVVLDCTDAMSGCVCYLILKDDGQMAIYKGASPGTNDQLIYEFPKYEVSKSVMNPSYPQNLSKTGSNWISYNVKLNQISNYEYVVSDDGKLLFFIGEDGNMYLSTFTLVEGCPTRRDSKGRNAYGGALANALYSFDYVPNNESNGKIGYVDDVGELREYSSDAIGYGKTYKKYAKYGSDSKTLNELKNSSFMACKTSCSLSDECAGFAFDNEVGTCYTKDETIYPKSARIPLANFDLYVRDLKVNNSNSCSKQITDIDSNMWKGYTQGQTMNADEICGLGKVLEDPHDKINDTQKEIDDVVIQINDKFSQLQQDNVKLTSDMIQLQSKIGQDLNEYNSVNESIDQKLTSQTTINSMLSDSHLMVLQENYKYTFLSIIAIGALVIAMKVGKNVPR